MYRTGIANPTQLAMLTRIMTTLAQEMNIEETSPRYDELAAHLMILFEASKNEQRLLTLMRRSAGFLHTRLTGSDSLSGDKTHPPELSPGRPTGNSLAGSASRYPPPIPR